MATDYNVPLKYNIKIIIVLVPTGTCMPCLWQCREVIKPKRFLRDHNLLYLLSEMDFLCS